MTSNSSSLGVAAPTSVPAPASRLALAPGPGPARLSIQTGVGPLTRWNYLGRSGGFVTTSDHDYAGTQNLRYTSGGPITKQKNVGYNASIMQFPQGSFASCRYPTETRLAQRTPELNTWHNTQSWQPPHQRTLSYPLSSFEVPYPTLTKTAASTLCSSSANAVPHSSSASVSSASSSSSSSPTASLSSGAVRKVSISF